jgi:REP element-mobilizing transposase RayT
MKQLSFLPKSKREHGGSLALGKRRARRPLNIKKPVHLVLRSDLAKGRRSLMSNQSAVLKVLNKFSRRFHIRIYEKAICGNHIHLLVKAHSRRQLQNFFRVLAGQVAQEILNKYPLQKHESKAFWGGTPTGRGKKGKVAHRKNQRTFWSLLLYTRIVSWGRDYFAVKAYVIQNTKEALGLIAYKPRKFGFHKIMTKLISNSS